MPNLLCRLENTVGDAMLVKISTTDNGVSWVYITFLAQHLEPNDNLPIYAWYDHEILDFGQYR